MLPSLTRPLVLFDLESTGLDISRDRIIQISYIKVLPSGEEERNLLLLNPECSIPAEVVALTGITDAMVAGAPTFKAVAALVAAVFRGSDIAGYNVVNFDLPLLAEEFLRAGQDIDLMDCCCIDVLQIYYQMEKRDLAAAYKFYCGRTMSDDFTAHRADEDTAATWRVLQAQLDRYSASAQRDEERILPTTIPALHARLQRNDNVDFAGRIVWEEYTDSSGTPQRREVFNFGKYKGRAVADVLRMDPGYYNWMMNADFPQYTKNVLTRIKLRQQSR